MVACSAGEVLVWVDPHPEGRTVICTESPRFNLCLSLFQCLVSEASVCEQEAKVPTVYSLQKAKWLVGREGVQLGERP